MWRKYCVNLKRCSNKSKAMKNIFTLCTIGLFTFLNVSLEAQSKADVLRALELIFELPDTETLFQHDMTEGQTLLILRPDNRRIGRQNAIENIIFDLTDDDFRYFSRPVRMISRQEARSQDIDERFLASLGLRVSPLQINLVIGAVIQEDLMAYTGTFSVIREDLEADWEINSQNFQMQKTR